jgi:hypothetical protein
MSLSFGVALSRVTSQEGSGVDVDPEAMSIYGFKILERVPVEWNRYCVHEFCGVFPQGDPSNEIRSQAPNYLSDLMNIEARRPEAKACWTKAAAAITSPSASMVHAGGMPRMGVKYMLKISDRA